MKIWSYTSAFTFIVALVTVLIVQSSLAQTAPTPTTTFTAGGDNLWKTDGNWSLGDTPTASDDARINDGETVVHDIDVLIDGATMTSMARQRGHNTGRRESNRNKLWGWHRLYVQVSSRLMDDSISGKLIVIDNVD